MVWRLSTEITSETLWLTLGKITLGTVLDYTGSIFPRIEHTAGREYLFSSGTDSDLSKRCWRWDLLNRRFYLTARHRSPNSQMVRRSVQTRATVLPS